MAAPAPGPMDPYPLLDLGALVALELPPREAVIDGLVYCRSLTRLGAREKAGKGLMGVDMACSTVLGEDFLGRSTRQGPVALIPLEELIGEVRQRILTRLGPDFDAATTAHAPLYVLPSDTPEAAEFRLEDPACIARLRATIEAFGLTMLFIDTLREAHGRKEDSSDEMAPVLKPLRHLAHDTGCAIVVVHHFNKLGTSRGSTAIDGAMDQLLSFTPDEGDGEVITGTLTAKGRFGQLRLRVRMGLDLRWEAVAGPATASGRGPSTRERVLGLLADAPNEGWTAKELALQLGIVPKTVENAISDVLRANPCPLQVFGDGTKGSPRRFAPAGAA